MRMYRSIETPGKIATHIENMDEISFARFLYCQQMSSVFMAVHLLEHAIIDAMMMCDEIRVKEILREDAEVWQKYLEKRKNLEASTLGSLIKILGRHKISASDLNYLRWIKDKRDFFVHRFFHEGGWPGDLDKEGCDFLRRRLLAIQTWLSRTKKRVRYILQRAGLLIILDLGEDGFLVENKNLANLL